MSGFSFRGRHSSAFGIHTQDQERVLLPPRREERIAVPGRSGFYDGAAGNVYDGREERVLCAFRCPPGHTVPQLCREIAWWLSGKGRQVYDKEPDKHYLARLTGAPPLEQHLRYGQFTLTWACDPPFAFGRTVTVPLVMGANQVDYRGTAEAPCLIVLRNPSDREARTVTITAVKRSDP